MRRIGWSETRIGDRRSALSGIETQIVHKLCEGYQSKEIAATLGKSKATVEGYIRILYAKLNARSRAQVVARAFTLGLIFDDDADEGALPSPSRRTG